MILGVTKRRAASGDESGTQHCEISFKLSMAGKLNILLEDVLVQ